MKKNDFIKTVAGATNLSLGVVKKVLEATFETLLSLDKEEKVIFKGFGTFRKKVSKGRSYKLKGILGTTPPTEKLIFKASKSTHKRLS